MHRIAAVELKQKLREITFPDGDNEENRLMQEFCKLLAARFESFFFEEWITSETFVAEYFETLISISGSPAPELIEDMIAASSYNVARVIFPPEFAEEVKTETITHIITSGVLRDRPSNTRIQ